MKIAVIGCTSLKKDYKCKVEEMYSKSTLFKYTLMYCKQKNFDNIIVLSAKYGILKLDDEVKPYNHSLSDKSLKERKKWYEEISNYLNSNYKNDEIIFYTSKPYFEGLKLNQKIVAPTKHLTIGYKLKFFKDNIK